MSQLAFWRAVVEDHSRFLEGIVELLDDARIRYCVIGGVGVNAYSEPVVTQDLDVVVALGDMERVRGLLEPRFLFREFDDTWNVRKAGSNAQVQIQLRPKLAPYVDRAQRRSVMGLWIPVADPHDLIQAKIAAALSPTRRGQKRLKDVADVRRLVDAFPELRDLVPPELAQRVFEFEDPPGSLTEPAE